MVTGIVIAAVLVGGVGLFIGVFLGVAGKKFAVEVDEKEILVREELPGNNCGGCGYPGCDGLAAAIAKGCDKLENVKAQILDLHFDTKIRKLFIGTFQRGVLIYDMSTMFGFI